MEQGAKIILTDIACVSTNAFLGLCLSWKDSSVCLMQCEQMVGISSKGESCYMEQEVSQTLFWKLCLGLAEVKKCFSKSCVTQRPNGRMLSSCFWNERGPSFGMNWTNTSNVLIFVSTERALYPSSMDGVQACTQVAHHFLLCEKVFFELLRGVSSLRKRR